MQERLQAALGLAPQVCTAVCVLCTRFFIYIVFSITFCFKFRVLLMQCHLLLFSLSPSSFPSLLSFFYVQRYAHFYTLILCQNLQVLVVSLLSTFDLIYSSASITTNFSLQPLSLLVRYSFTTLAPRCNTPFLVIIYLVLCSSTVSTICKTFMDRD